MLKKKNVAHLNITGILIFVNVDEVLSFHYISVNNIKILVNYSQNMIVLTLHIYLHIHNVKFLL